MTINKKSLAKCGAFFVSLNNKEELYVVNLILV